MKNFKLICVLLIIAIISVSACLVIFKKNAVSNNTIEQTKEESSAKLTGSKDTNDASDTVQHKKKIPNIGVSQTETANTNTADDTKADTDFDKCVEAVTNIMNGVSGKCSWSIKSLSEGDVYTIGSGRVPSASVIKIFIMDYAYNLITKGELKSDDTISGNTVERLINSMITQSDNYATNVFIEYFGMDYLNEYFVQCGYTDTVLQRKMLDFEAQGQGKENYTSVNDVMDFLTKLYTNRHSAPYSDMLEIMKKQQVRTKIPLLFPSDVVIANKTGELSNVENDVGIILGKDCDLAVVFLCSSLSDTYSARNAISNSAYKFYQIMNK